MVAWQFAGNNLTVIRPLLPLGREETINYCAYHQLVPCIDASNLSMSPLRNKVRHQLLPLLRSYNPQIFGALLRAAGIAGDDLDFLDEEVSRVWDSLALGQENAIVLDREKLLKLSPPLQRHLLRTAIEKLAGNLRDIEAVHIEDMIAALSKPAGKMLNLPGGLVFSIDYDKYLIGSEPVASCPFPQLEGDISLKVPGETRLPGWRITATTISREQMAENGESEEASAPSEAEGWFIEGRVKGLGPFTKYSSPSPLKERGIEGVRLTENRFAACFDFGKAGDKLVIRARKLGDRFQPLGMSQSKKLGEFMIDARIPRAWRERVPLVCSPDQILWVVGWRIDERAKVTEATRKVLLLELSRDSF
jgi:tRNA(Ile)-lysidine synthase